jgi:hypothetical protein
MKSPCCLCVCVPPSVNFQMPEPVFMKPGMHIIVTEPISTAYFINPPISVCVCMSRTHIVARQRSVNTFPQQGIHAATCSRWFVARGFFYPEDGGDVPPKRRFTQDQHGATSQKTTFFLIEELLEALFSMWSGSY